MIACSLRVHSWRQTTSELNGSTSELSKSTPCEGVLSLPSMDSDVIRHVDTLVNYGSLLKTVHNELGTAEKVELRLPSAFPPSSVGFVTCSLRCTSRRCK